MNAKWERVAGPPRSGTRLFMDAVLTPHRSLSARAFKTMLIGVIAINVVIATVFAARGAYPVAGFAGLDVLALWLAFRWNYRSGQIEERVSVDREHVCVSRRGRKGETAHWAASALWARADVDESSVAIRSAGAAQRVGAFLSPPERASFARALNAALARAKGGG